MCQVSTPKKWLVAGEKPKGEKAVGQVSIIDENYGLK
jgi:hypothetical protein